jgi:tetratricopeptide (TPR) repeat protein
MTTNVSVSLLASLFSFCPVFLQGAEGWAKDLLVPEAYPSLEQAIEAAVPGTDRVVVTDGGARSESVVVAKDLTLVSDPPGAGIVGATASGLILRRGASTVRVSGFTISNCAQHGIRVDPGDGFGVDLTLYGVTLQSNKEHGVAFVSGEKHKLRAGGGCVAEGNGGAGVHCSLPVQERAGVMDVRLTGMRLSRNGGAGLEVLREGETGARDDLATVTLENCSITSNTTQGVQLANMSCALSVTGCTVALNRQSGIVVGVGATGKVDVRLSNTSTGRNRGHGLLAEGSEVAVDATNGCKFNGNGLDGIVVPRGRRIALNLSGSEWVGNQRAGLYVSSTAETDDASALAQATLDDCLIRSNQFVGLSLWGNTKQVLTVTNSTVEGNQGVYGLWVDSHGKGAEARLSNTSVSNNAGWGLGIGPSDRALIVADGNCAFVGNTDGGILSDMPTDVRLTDCSVALNGGPGISLRRQTSDRDGDGSRVSIRNANVQGNAGPGISVDDPVLLLAQGAADAAVSGNWTTRWGFLSNSCNAIITDSVFSGNESGVVSPRVAGGAFLTETLACTLIEGTDGAPTAPLSRVTDAGFLPAPIDHLTSATFADLEGGFANRDSAAALLEIGDLFLGKCGGDVAQTTSATLAYLQSSPDAAIACRLFQNAVGDRLRFEDAAHCAALASIVERHPNSAVADAICAELAMESVHWASLAKAKKDFVANCAAPPGSLAGILLAALPADGTSRETALAAFRTAYDKAGAQHPAGREKARGAFSHQAETSGAADVDLYVRRCEVLTDCLRQARAWHDLGKPARSQRFLALARRARTAFQPARPTAYFLPEELQAAFQDTKQALADAPAATVEKTLELTLGDDAPATATERLNVRLSALGALAYLASQARALPEMPPDLAAGSLENDLRAVFRDDLLALLQGGADPEVFRRHVFFLERTLLPSMSRDEAVAMLDRLAAQAGSALTQPSRLSIEGHHSLARLYRGLASPTQEAAHLRSVADLSPVAQEVVAALNRLTELYESFWKLPGRAIETQREIASDLPGTEHEWAARLKIARILYDQKDYAQSIVALTDLIDKMSADFPEDEVRTLLGLAHIGAKSFSDARAELARVAAMSESKHRPQCLYLTGYAFVCEQKYPEALEPFLELAASHPDSPFAERARPFIRDIRDSQWGR